MTCTVFIYLPLIFELITRYTKLIIHDHICNIYKYDMGKSSSYTNPVGKGLVNPNLTNISSDVAVRSLPFIFKFIRNISK